MSGSRGKSFERELKASLEAHDVYVMRIPDKVYWNGNRMASETTPADFVAFYYGSKNLSGIMIECKAESSASIAFSRLQAHQLAALESFDAAHDDMHGYIAVDFYDKDNIRKSNICYMVPVSVWREKLDEMHAGARKSIPVAFCENDPRVVRCDRAKGSTFDVRPFVNLFM